MVAKSGIKVGVVAVAKRTRRWLLVLVFASAVALGSDPPAVAATGHVERAYVTVDDGTQIALAIWYPAGFKATDRHNWPALFEMDGYQGYQPMVTGNDMNDTEFFGRTDRYVVVYALVRGTGCSGGQFNLFSPRSSLDGRYIIDHWIPRQTWSNGLVGITGHSYSGLTAFLVAATHPRHAKAIAVSGVIDDLYRGILYPGGVLNEGFPILWGALLRPAEEFAGNATNYSDPQCAQNQLQHRGTDTVPLTSMLLPIFTQTTAAPGTWGIEHSLFRVESGIRAPIQINQQYQDEQTGPRGGYGLWQQLPAGLPKRLVVSNGQHNPNDPAGDKNAWLDCWLIDEPAGRPCETVTGENSAGGTVTVPVDSPSARVLLYFESRVGGPEGQLRNRPYLTSDWPPSETNWKLYYLRADHTLGSSPGPDGSLSYVSTTSDEHTTGTAGVAPASNNPGAATFTDGPNEARFALPFAATTALTGPMEINLWIQSTAPDTDVFVDLLDYDPATGETAYLQRGLLRASFRAVDPSRSDRITTGPLAGTIYRPYHPFLTRQLLTPGQAYLLPIEIFPLGHVFYPGHELIINIHAPPANDPITPWAYAPEQSPGVDTILQDPQHRSTLLLPFLPHLPPLWPDGPTPCGQIAGYVCFTSSAAP